MEVEWNVRRGKNSGRGGNGGGGGGGIARTAVVRGHLSSGLSIGTSC